MSAQPAEAPGASTSTQQGHPHSSHPPPRPGSTRLSAGRRAALAFLVISPACRQRLCRPVPPREGRPRGEGAGGGLGGPRGCCGSGGRSPLSSRAVAVVPQAGRLPVKMSYMLPHLHNGWQVDQAILSEEDRVVVIRFGHDWDPTCMKMDEVLYSIAEKVNPQLHRGGVVSGVC